MRKRGLSFLLAIFLSIIVFEQRALAHDSKIIHPFTLSGKALELLFLETGGTPGDYSGSRYFELYQYFYDKNLPSGYDSIHNYVEGLIQKQGTLGTIQEDDTEISFLPPHLWPRPMNHFYNPATGLGIVGQASALVYGPTLWEKAIEKKATGSALEM